MTDLSRFVQLIYSGRGILLAGQELEPGSSNALAALIAEAVGGGRTGRTLSKLCQELTSAQQLIALLEGPNFAARVGGDLRHIADVPWAGVITSALDDRLTEALAATDSEGRRLHHIFPEEGLPRIFSHKTHVLSVVHLGRSPGAHSLTGVPLVGRKWRRSKRRYVPVVLDALPKIVGLGHVLCIAGISADDLIGVELLGEVLSDIDPDNIYWFVGDTDGLAVPELRAAVPNIHIIEGSLAATLAEYLSKNLRREEAQKQKAEVIDLEDFLVTVRRNGEERVVRFRTSELREFRTHLAVLGDFPATSSAASLEERRDQFIRFLSLPRQTPDWFGIPEGYVFERTAYRKLLKAVLNRVNRITREGNSRSKKSSRSFDAPIFLAGPPASGRTVGLHWLGCELRKEKIFTVHLIAAGDTVSPFAIEKFVRLAESRGAPLCVVIADRLDRHTTANLERRLRTAGRRSIVVGSATQLPAISFKRDDEPEIDERDPSGEEVSLDYRLSPNERKDFQSYLEENGALNSDLVARQIADNPELFALLYRLVRESRENITAVLVEEYQRLVHALVSFQPPDPDTPTGGSTLRENLIAWWEQHDDLHAPSGGDALKADSGGSEQWIELAVKLPQVVMLFSSLDQAVSLDLLLRVFPHLLRYYEAVYSVCGKSGLIHEIPLDREQNVGLMSVNQMVAKIILQAVTPSSGDRLRILGDVLNCFPWNSEAMPVDYPDQARLIQLLRSISPPNGTYQHQYRRIDDMQSLAEILKSLREDQLFESVPLMRNEGILLRHIGRQISDELDQADPLDFYRRSHKVLEQARDIVASRQPSPARSVEMAAILNASATTLGHIFTSISKRESPMSRDCRKLVDEVLETASASRAFRDDYYPLDIAFWVNRDCYRRLRSMKETPEIDDEKVRLVNNMANTLDTATELESMPADQRDRYESRRSELQVVLGDFSLAEEIAQEAAQRKLFSGVCVIARARAIDIETGNVLSRDHASEALEYLKRFEPEIFQDERGTTLMHRLWTGKHLGNHALDDGPHAIGCELEDWRELERITRARNALSGDSPSPYVSFWLAVALAHQGDIFGAIRPLETVEAATFGFSHRRLNPLVFLADRDGKAREFRSVVRRREPNEAITLFVPSLGIEVHVQRRYQGSSVMLNVQRGDEALVHVAFSYWHPMGIATDWKSTRRESIAAGTQGA